MKEGIWGNERNARTRRTEKGTYGPTYAAAGPVMEIPYVSIRKNRKSESRRALGLVARALVGKQGYY